ncbi:MAG: 2-C-methyl-D-erythritol 4-phosphate cytidylyltransferase [Dehalococcoidia bacterium]|nr:2-C-methyl-D-erythritol 4-phosphate cytidylyltransferase [Dehalococcoidia bacterium]
MSKVAAIVVAAGMGQRMGKDKIFTLLGGKPVIAWSLDALQKSEVVDAIVLVLHKDTMDMGRKLVSFNSWPKINTVCEGGERRQDSVRNGLSAVNNSDWVLIHDGARPFLTGRLIEDGLKAAAETGAAAAAVEVKDTIKQAEETGICIKTFKRDMLRAVQTPQVFRFDLIKKVYELVSGEFTDDAAIAERAGYRVKLYPGEYKNIKITTPEDLLMAEILAKVG